MLILFCKAGKSEKKIYRILRYNFFITKNWKKTKGTPFFKGELGDKRLV